MGGADHGKFRQESGQLILDTVLGNEESVAAGIELKWNQSARGAISQIKEKKYPEGLKEYGGEILLVGIAYKKDAKEKDRKYTCLIERLKK